MVEPRRKSMFSVSLAKPNVTVLPVLASTLASMIVSGRVPNRPVPESPPSSRML